MVHPHRMHRAFKVWSACAAVTLVAIAGCVDPSPQADRAGSIVIHMVDLKYDPIELMIPPGTTVTWVNDDPFEHTVTPTDKGQWGTQGSGDAISRWLGQGQSWSFKFEEPGTFEYYCIPHASQDAEGLWRGMVAKVIVQEGAPLPGSREAVASPGPAQPVDLPEIGAEAHELPPPLQRTQPTHVTFNITSQEVTAAMADGTTYTYWTFDNQVPGPMLRVMQGDTVTVNLYNEPTSTNGHNIDFHAVTGPGGGAGILDADPGETATLTFKALNAGLYIYHCAFQDPPLHIAHGMYGLILVEPEGGLPPVDKEFYVVQGDFYSAFDAGDKGHHDYDGDRASHEDPTFVVFNGRVGSLKDPDRRLQADVGDTVRLFVGNGGPNLVSSFHVIGEIFDRVWDQGAIISAPQQNVQTTLVPAGGAAMVEFDLEVPGDYFLVDHSIFRIHKGAFGVLHATGDEAPDVYREGP